MPKVTILEKDLTSSGQQSSDNFVVLIPGVYSENLWAEGVNQEPILVSNTSTTGEAVTFDEFNAIIFGNEQSGTENVEEYIKNSYGYKATEKLVGLGMTVLYGIIKLDDDEIAEPDYTPLDVLEDDYFDKYADRSLFDIRFITTGGWVTPTSAANAIYCAATRGDAVALVDIPQVTEFAVEESGVTTYIDLTTAEGINEYLNTVIYVKPVERTFVSGGTTKEDSYTYGAAFTPTFKYFVGTRYDEETGTFTKEFEEELGSFAYLSAFANHINRFPEWYAMAGSVRGVLPYTQVQPTLKFGMNEINEYLTTRDGRVRACNPLCEVRPYGNILFGNRTLYATSGSDIEKYGIGLRASHFLNIRQLCCTLKKVLYRASRKFMFEPNTDVLWVNFCETIRPTLELMKTNQGIRGYSIERESTNVKGVLKAKIIIVPIEALEDFDLTVELADSVEISE